MKDAIDVTIKPRKSFIKVYDFMYRDLELKGVEILVYAYIHQFPAYYITLDEIAKTLGINIKTVMRILKELEVKRLILKRTISITGNLKRSIYVALFKEDGRYDLDRAMADLQKAEENIRFFYKEGFVPKNVKSST